MVLSRTNPPSILSILYILSKKQSQVRLNGVAMSPRPPSCSAIDDRSHAEFLRQDKQDSQDGPEPDKPAKHPVHPAHPVQETVSAQVEDLESLRQDEQDLQDGPEQDKSAKHPVDPVHPVQETASAPLERGGDVLVALRKVLEGRPRRRLSLPTCGELVEVGLPPQRPEVIVDPARLFGCYRYGVNQASLSLIPSMKLLKVLGTSVALLAAALVAFLLYTTQQAYHYQSVLGSVLDRDLGFRHGSPYFSFGDDSFEVFTLHPLTGGPMHAAGVRDSDIVLDHSITGFYRTLHEHRGSTIAFRVTDGGDGIPMNQRPVRTVTLSIPAQLLNQ
jgi:hypothetical protein